MRNTLLILFFGSFLFISGCSAKEDATNKKSEINDNILFFQSKIFDELHNS